MTDQSVWAASAPGATCPSLVNEVALFDRLLPRFFTGIVREVLGELLQNSQRAGATEVEFAFPSATQCAYRDNGHGLTGGLADLYSLLRLVDSRYEDESVEANQSPLGVGFYSLLALAGMRRVRVESLSVALDIETGRWLHDQDYRQSWPSRVERRSPRGEAGTGFCLLIDGEERLMEEVRALLREADPGAYDFTAGKKPMGPARGYAGILQVTLDGSPVNTALPAWFALPEAEIEDSYLGNEIRIQLSIQGHRGGVHVSWYGQPIVEPLSVRWSAYLSVRSGRPVTPQAPTRQHLIKDQALAALHAWIEARIFRFVCSQADPAVQHVAFLYEMDPRRAAKECPYVIVSPWYGLPDRPVKSSYDLHRHTLGAEEVVRKRDLASRLVLDEQVVVLLPPAHPAARLFSMGREHVEPDAEARPVAFSQGVESFIAAAGIVAYQAGAGAEPNGVLWWGPGPLADDLHTTEPGRWGIGGDQEPPLEWKPLSRGNVYVHDVNASWDIGLINCVIGVAGKDGIIAFLKRYGPAMWEEDDDEEDQDNCIASFKESIRSLIRGYLGDTIARSLVSDLLASVRSFCPIGGGNILSIELLYDEQPGEEGSGGSPGQGSARLRTGPQRVRVGLESGESRVLSLY